MNKSRFCILVVLAISVAGGCITSPQDPAATQPATAIDPETAQPGYWLDQPGVASTSHSDFEQLFNACEQIARDHLYRIDRVDYRLGLLTTHPRVSPQFFELWRKDIGTNHDVAESTLATIRRSARFEFSRDDANGGVVTVQPKVLVERYAQVERRITAVVQYRTALSPGAADRGTRERDAGVIVPERPYWYAIGRDKELERKLADAIGRKLKP